MIRFLISHLIRKMQKRLAFLSDNRGIKLLLRLQGILHSLALGTIKISERAKGGINPKHWVTDFHNFFLDNIKPSDTVLEVGCAYGHVANAIAKKAKHVTAIDIRSEAIEKAKQHFKRNNLSFLSNDFFDFADEEKFDIVILSNVLEHINERQSFLKKAAALGEKLLIRVPSFDRDWLVPYKKELGLEWRLNKDHKLEYTEDILRQELNRSGLAIENLFCKWGNYCCVATKKGIDIE